MPTSLHYCHDNYRANKHIHVYMIFLCGYGFKKEEVIKFWERSELLSQYKNPDFSTVLY